MLEAEARLKGPLTLTLTLSRVAAVTLTPGPVNVCTRTSEEDDVE